MTACCRIGSLFTSLLVEHSIDRSTQCLSVPVGGDYGTAGIRHLPLVRPPRIVLAKETFNCLSPDLFECVGQLCSPPIHFSLSSFLCSAGGRDTVNSGIVESVIGDCQVVDEFAFRSVYQ